MSETEGFTSVSVAAAQAFVRGRHAEFEFYLPGAEGEAPVLYRRSGEDVSKPDFARMNMHGVSSILVRADAYDDCVETVEHELKSILGSTEVPPEDKAQITHIVGNHIARDLADEFASTEDVARASDLIDTMLERVVQDPGVSAHLMLMAGHERTVASHMFFTAALSLMLGTVACEADEVFLKNVGMAGMLHDMGKLSAPRDLLNKTEPLTRSEILFIQQHPIESVRMVCDDAAVSAEACKFIVQHHERVDGKGYPLGVAGSDFLLGSRVVAIADSFHAMTGPRSYRSSMTAAQANRVLEGQAGRQFDPDLVVRWHDMFGTCLADTEYLRGMRASHQSDELSPRNEHRCAPARSNGVDKRPPRHECHERVSVQCSYVAPLFEEQGVSDDFDVRLHDLSGGGLCVTSGRPMYRGEIVDARVELDGDLVWIRCAVAWCRQHEGDSYRAGLCFLSRMRAEDDHHPVPILGMADYPA